MSFALKCLAFIFCLAVSGCGSTKESRHSKKMEEGYPAAIHTVLDARNDIRVVISHTPQSPAELAAANQDPTALVFSVQDYVKRLRTVSLKGCPDEFKAAFVKYAEAWNDRAAATPTLILPLGVGKGVPEESDPAVAERTETTWHALQRVVAEYNNPTPKSGD